jgi:predicted lipid-binding transport protein (Tim44 family)
MSQSTPARPAINLALIGLWVVTAVVLAVGIWLLLSSNGRQVELYTGQSEDYAAYLSAQGGTTLGGILIGVGVLGLLLSLATQAVVSAANRRHADLASSYVAYDFDDTEVYDDDSAEVPAAPAPAAPAPAAAAAPAAPAAAAPAAGAPAVVADETVVVAEEAPVADREPGDERPAAK